MPLVWPDYLVYVFLMGILFVALTFWAVVGGLVGPKWTTWRTVKIDIQLGVGDTKVTLAHTAADRGSVNAHQLTLA